ncbi:cob(I)yrinic acid a,c-diamide adenosyltransferase [Hydrogenimonas sp.]
MERKGQIQLYTGDGKGKSTAAAGLALRALDAGWRVLFVQFMKSVPSGEVAMLRRLGDKRCEVLQEWDDSFIIGVASEKQKAMGRRLWERTVARVESFGADLLVLDEIAVALSFDLVDEEAVLAFLKARPEGLEVVMTGRGAAKPLIEASDLVTEMRKVKHYFDSGVQARKGIEW